ncbi:Gp15 family bacteriophage protein [Geobacillus icigianus]|uniref:Bacteriophage Gp15 protein n=1 Tax=Geobacillus subterraneus TaxID=129338 RepID=A0A679FML0_9BACL|nr:Gp15 family bacteriophage protein [Geobacillus subterraneus]BBW97223.1 hypothetical protein GsuE55_20560 [Geobacillus subterraneus]
MFSLTERFEDEFEYHGKIIRLNLAFDQVLRVMELQDDPVFWWWEKVDIALEMLIENYEDIANIPLNEKVEMYAYIFNEFINDKPKQEETSGKKVFDFKQDAGLIYASFLAAYGIDLFEQHGKLHWKKFMQLLTHLPKDTAFKEVVVIRQEKLPPPNKHNQEYRKYLMEMKRLYRLKDDDPGMIDDYDRVKEIDRKWDAVAAALKRKAVK